MGGVLEFISKIMPSLLRLGEQLFADTDGDWEKSESMIHNTIKYYRGKTAAMDDEMQKAVNRFDK